MRQAWWVLVLLLVASVARAAAVSGEKSVVVYGKADRDIPGWTIHTVLPEGWTQDCCMYARAIGVNEVLYKGDWTGEPERVMVLNVWPSKLPTLVAELGEDRKQYLQRDPKAQVGDIAVNNSAMACRGTYYEGTDHKDDIVVFCDPGKASGIRLSWSMTLAHDDKDRQDLMALFRRVAEASSYAVSRSAKGDATNTQH